MLVRLPGLRARIVSYLVILLCGYVFSATPAHAENLAAGKHAGRAAQVAIPKTQFRQAGGFNADQFSGFRTWVTLSREINDDLKKGISRTPDYCRRRQVTIDHYFHQEVLARSTLLSDKDDTPAAWLTSVTPPLKLTEHAGVVADVAKDSVEAAASIYAHQFSPTKALRNQELIKNYQRTIRHRPH